LRRREGTVDRVTNGVAVVLVEEDGETVDEVHFDAERLPEYVGAGERVCLLCKGENTVVEALALIVGALLVFVGSAVLTTATPTTLPGPGVELPSEPATVAVNAVSGALTMLVGASVAVPRFDSLLGRPAVYDEIEAHSRGARLRVERDCETNDNAEEKGSR